MLVSMYEINEEIKKTLDTLRDDLCERVFDILEELQDDCVCSKRDEVPLFDLLMHLVFLTERRLLRVSDQKELEEKKSFDFESLTLFYSNHFVEDSFLKENLLKSLEEDKVKKERIKKGGENES